MPQPIDHLSYAELEALEAQIAIRKRELRQRNAESVRRQLELAVKAEGMTIEEVFGPTPGRRLPRAVYRNPDNPRQTWPGRGPAPRWMRDKLAQGIAPEALAISA